jgi:hypothetical protein
VEYEIEEGPDGRTKAINVTGPEGAAPQVREQGPRLAAQRALTQAVADQSRAAQQMPQLSGLLLAHGLLQAVHLQQAQAGAAASLRSLRPVPPFVPQLLLPAAAVARRRCCCCATTCPPVPAAGRPSPQLLPQQLSNWRRLSSRRCWQLQRQRPRPGAPHGHGLRLWLWGRLRLLWRHGLCSIRLPSTRHGLPHGGPRHAGRPVPRARRALPSLWPGRARHAGRRRLHAGSWPAG